MSAALPTIEHAIEEFLALRDAGSTLGARAFAERHPHLAPELHTALQSLELLAGAGEALRAGPASELPSRIGAYRITREVGRGGMGIVLEAVEEPLGRRVALKLLPPGLVSSAAARARFQREAVLASRLEHPGVCTVFGAGVSDAQPWIAMRFVDGTTLAQRIREARTSSASSVELPRDPGEPAHVAVARCIARVARALEFAHGRGVLHRDVKPSNLMVTDDGQPVLLDFGLAIEPDGEGTVLTRTGETSGTPAYLAPELLAGERARPDERCDVYALGVTLYECLTLVTPFAGPTREALFRSILAGSVQDVRRQNGDVSRDLAVVVATAIERDPMRRYASAALLAQDLEAFVAGRPIAARPVGMLGRVARWAQREPRQAVLASGFALAALASAVAVGAWATSRDDARAGRESQAARAFEDALAFAYSDVALVSSAQSDARFAELLRLDPGSEEALVGRVFAHARAKDKPRALELLRDAPATRAFDRLREILQAEFPPPADATWLEQATAFELFIDGEALRMESERRPRSERAEWLRPAVERYSEAIVRSSRACASYHQMLALTASTLGDRRATNSACNALVGLWPDSAWSLYQAGAALCSLDPERALAVLQRSAELDATRAATFQCIGMVHYQVGELDLALAPLRRAIELNPRDVEAWNSLGAVWMRFGCPDEANVAFREALSIDPRAIGPWANLCKLAPDVEGTASAAEHVLELDPGQTAYRAVYASSLEQLGNLSGACDQFAICVAQSPMNAAYWVSYAGTLIQMGDLSTARHAALVAHQIAPEAPGLAQVEDYLRDAPADE